MDKNLKQFISQSWDRLSDLRTQFLGELKGERPFPKNKLNNIVLDIADVMAKHGYPLEHNEDYNALRLAIAKEYFSEWQNYDTSDCISYVSWVELREKRNASLIASVKKHLGL